MNADYPFKKGEVVRIKDGVDAADEWKGMKVEIVQFGEMENIVFKPVDEGFNHNVGTYSFLHISEIEPTIEGCDHETVLWHDGDREFFCPFCPGNPPTSNIDRTAKDYGITLHPWQRKILYKEGRRCLVGGRQVGKTITGKIDIIDKSTKGNVLIVDESTIILDDRVQARIDEGQARYINNRSLKDYVIEPRFNTIVIDNAGDIRKDDLPEGTRFLQRFENVLILGTPSPDKKSLLEWAYGHPQYDTGHVSSWEVDHIDNDRLDELVPKMTTERIKREFNAQFIYS